MSGASLIRILMVEDLPADAELAERLLRKDGLAVTFVRVETQDAFVTALADFKPDLILSDYTLPEFDGLEALRLTRAHEAALPFILLTGSLNEEIAVACMKAGATDYILKERLSRLPFAVKEALQQKETRSAKAEAERALHESKASLEASQQVAHVGHWTWDIRTNQVICSDELYRIFGVSPESSANDLSQFIQAAIHPDDQAKVLAANAALLTGLAPTSLEYRLLRPDGSIRTVWAVPGEKVVGAQGEILKLTGIVQDITERKQVEEAWRESEERFRAVAQSATDAIVSIDSAGAVIYWNTAAEMMFGYTSTEMLGRLFGEIIPERFQVTVGTDWRRAMAAHLPPRTGSIVELAIRHQTAGEIPVELSLSHWHTPAGQFFTAIIRDITERKQSEARVRQLSRAVEQSPASILITDPTGAIQYVNPKFTQVTGYTLEEVVGQNPRVLKSGYTPAQEYEQLWQAITAGREWHGEFRNRKKSGELYWDRVSISTVVDADGGITNYVAVAEDITAHKQHSREQAAIVAVSTALRTAATRDEMLLIILDQVRILLDVEEVALVMLLPETGETVVEMARGAWEALAGQKLPVTEGVSGRVIATGQPFVSNTVQHDPQPRRLALAKEVVAAAILPLRAQQQTMGALAVGSRHAVDGHQLRLLEAVSDIAATALQRATLHEQTRRRADEFAALYATAHELATQQDVPWLLETIVRRAVDLIPATGALIARCGPAQADLEIAVVNGLPIPLETRLPWGTGAAGRIAQTWQPLILDDYHTWDNRVPQFDDIPFRAVLGVPMVAGGSLMGVLVLADLGPSGRRFTSTDAELLTLFATHAASALYNAQVLEDTRRWADQLTLLYDAGLALNRVLEPQAQLEQLSKIAGQAVQADIVEFFHVDPRTRAMNFELNLAPTETVRTHWQTSLPNLLSEHGFVAEVMRTRRPLNLPDLYADPRYIVIDPGIHSGLWVPVEHQGQLRGILGVLSRRPRAFSGNDERLLLLFANQTAVAIQNASLLAETERRLRYVQALRHVDITMASSLELRPILDVVLHQTATQLRVDAAAILLLDPQQLILEHFISRGFRTSAIERSKLRLGEGPTGRAIQGQTIVAIPDLSRAPERLARADLLNEEGLAAYYAAPLIFRGRIKGVLEVFHRAPLNPDSEWLEYLETLAGQAALAVDNVGLFSDLQRTNAELTQAYDATIEGWSRALDLRDKETEGHSLRVTEMTLQLARAMGLDAAELIHLRRGALLHDIGKMGVPDSILLKPDRLTDAEWEVMRQHPQFAMDMLTPITFLRPALDIPGCHHEKWDGSGYPHGLKGEQIPWAARLFAVVDVWDALRSDRPYRRGWPDEKVIEYIQAGRGTHFDPRVVEVFLKLIGGA